MNDFTASNGRRLWKDGDGNVRAEFDAHNTVTYVRAENFTTLAEFFQAEADERLARWRWPENPDYVVYPTPSASREVSVVHERSGTWGQWSEAGARYERSRDFLADAATAFFDAHPEPKPWLDAKPGEVWEVTFSDGGGGGTDPLTVDRSGNFSHPNYVGAVKLHDSTILNGRRIWPTEVS